MSRRRAAMVRMRLMSCLLVLLGGGCTATAAPTQDTAPAGMVATGADGPSIAQHPGTGPSSTSPAKGDDAATGNGTPPATIGGAAPARRIGIVTWRFQDWSYDLGPDKAEADPQAIATAVVATYAPEMPLHVVQVGYPSHHDDDTAEACTYAIDQRLDVVLLDLWNGAGPALDCLAREGIDVLDLSPELAVAPIPEDHYTAIASRPLDLVLREMWDLAMRTPSRRLTGPPPIGVLVRDGGHHRDAVLRELSAPARQAGVTLAITELPADQEASDVRSAIRGFKQAGVETIIMLVDAVRATAHADQEDYDVLVVTHSGTSGGPDLTYAWNRNDGIVQPNGSVVGPRKRANILATGWLPGTDVAEPVPLDGRCADAAKRLDQPEARHPHVQQVLATYCAGIERALAGELTGPRWPTVQTRVIRSDATCDCMRAEAN